MAELEWRRTSPYREEATGPGGARCIVEDDGGVARVSIVLKVGAETISDGFSGPYDVIARGKEWCGNICTWASGTKREGANRG